MKSIVLFILVAVMLAGCSRSVDVRLARVNALAKEDYVDSAMQALDSIDRASLNGEFNRRYHDLMTVKTRDKADLPFESDSLALLVMEYFKEHGTDTVRAEACYYAGRVARELGDSPQALDYMQSALDCLNDSHARLKGKISSQMGQIFLNLYLFEQAKPRFKDAIKYNHASGDTLALFFNYTNLGETFYWLQENDSSLICYNRALDLTSINTSCKKKQLHILLHLTNYYININDSQNACKTYDKIKNIITEGQINSEAIINITMRIQAIKGDYASCLSLANKLLESHSIYSKKYAYNVLMELAVLNNDPHEIYLYTTKYKECVDSINMRRVQQQMQN